MDLLDESQKKEFAELSGAEHFLVGLSSHYWAHTPMMIADLHSLGHVNQLDCIICQDHFVPVSKCDICGIIVNVDRKSNGSTMYLLDDGTGMVDCIVWSDRQEYQLPDLHGGYIEKKIYAIGDMVRVMGKLRTVSIGDRREWRHINGNTWEVKNCIREVHVITIDLLDQTRMNPRHHSCDAETRHWLRALRWKHDANTPRIQKPKDVLLRLGPQLTKDALERNELPSADDTAGEWRVFGTSCRCDLTYKEDLLYCHCQATAETLDPKFEFRDAMLSLLLEWEEASQTKPLLFQYSTILTNVSLREKANEIASRRKEKDDIAITRLFLNTVRALRNNGILCLVDTRADTYLLISRQHVLEPHMKRTATANSSFVDKKIVKSDRNQHLRNVPYYRLQYIKRCLTIEQAEEEEKMSKSVP